MSGPGRFMKRPYEKIQDNTVGADVQVGNKFPPRFGYECAPGAFA